MSASGALLLRRQKAKTEEKPVKEIVQFEADDGKVFTEMASCLAYEARLTFIRLFDQTINAVAADADFRDKIEALGTQLARDRRERGELRRERKRRGDNGSAEPPPDPPLYFQSPYLQPPDDANATDAHERDEGGA